MKIFISWSGDLSRNLAGELRDWLPNVLQYVKPFFSPEHIAKGSNWTNVIAQELDSTSIGIFCLTSDNLEAPWIHYEAGAVAKHVSAAHVCTLLFNLTPADVTGPLATFNHTIFNQQDVGKLIKSIDAAAPADEAITDVARLEKVFDKWWPELDKAISKVLRESPQILKQTPRDEREMIVEILDLVRAQQNTGAPFYAHEKPFMEVMGALDYLLLRDADSEDGIRHMCRKLENNLSGFIDPRLPGDNGRVQGFVSQLRDKLLVECRQRRIANAKSQIVQHFDVDVDR